MTAAPATLRSAHASGLAAVSRELSVLHGAMLRAGGDEGGTRLSVLTLVVACTDPGAADRAAAVVEGIAAEHPARAILVVADPGAAPGIDAELSLRCSVAGHGQVCVELVRLSVGGDAALHLASCVTPLLLPDVPVHLWLTGGAPPVQALQPDAVALCERLVVDSAEYDDPGALFRALGDAAHRAGRPLPLADLAWLRLDPWRDLVARAFDPRERRAFAAQAERVAVMGGGRAAAAEALLLAGWLHSRLGSPPASVAPAASGLALESVTVEAALAGRRLALSVERRGDELSMSVRVDGDPLDERTVPVERPTTSELVGAALQATGVDAVHADAVRAAAAGLG